MLHLGATCSFPPCPNLSSSVCMGGGQGQCVLPASVVRALHMTTATDHRLPPIYQHYAEAGGAIPPQFITIYTYGTALQLEISTRSSSDAEGFVTAICKTDHAGRLSGRLPMGLALLGEMDAVPYHGRISGLGLSTDYDFGESTEKWQRAGSGGYALIFVLRPAWKALLSINSNPQVGTRPRPALKRTPSRLQPLHSRPPLTVPGS
jgi:hypothetical protein